MCLFFPFLPLLDSEFNAAEVDAKVKSAGEEFERKVSSGHQVFTVDPTYLPVHKAIPKISGKVQASGEAQYVDDLPDAAFTGYAAYVRSDSAPRTKGEC